MAGSIVQSVWATGTTSAAPAFAVNTTAGNCLVAIAVDPWNQGDILSISHTGGGTFNNIITFNEGSFVTTLAMWVLTNCPGGADTVTVTNTTVSGHPMGAVIVELSGIGLSSPTDGTSDNTQTAPGAGANAIVTTNATNSATAFGLAFCWWGNSGGVNTISAGTGWTSTTSGNIHATGFGSGSVGVGRIEWQSGIAAAASQATFTDSTNGGTAGNHYITLFAKFDEATAGDTLIGQAIL